MLDPPLHPPLRAITQYGADTEWIIAGTFVNKITPASDTNSERHDLDPNLLYRAGVFRPRTTVWWIDGSYEGAEKAIFVQWNHLEFFNGQTISHMPFPQGRVQVHRPKLSGFDFGSFRQFLVVNGGDLVRYGDLDA